ncbi:hypothetical protein [Methylocaldum sp.]|uniref:hypothetical protein n=1 Tax=Methylocaldum sp. TaxID=1969727 RepID=UPI002D4FC7A6|nr:hypothetical protein [Methylocaldum sp.]HYE34680.1 hypothetical protein [Methylocaldum sp.]
MVHIWSTPIWYIGRPTRLFAGADGPGESYRRIHSSSFNRAHSASWKMMPSV